MSKEKMFFEMLIGISTYFITLILLIVIYNTIIRKYLNKAEKYKEEIKSLKEPDLNEEQFSKTFNIICDYCKKEFNTSNKNCPYCGGAYHNNKLFIEENKKKYIEYYNYLQSIQDEIEKKFATYYSVIKDLKKNIFVSHSCFNIDVKYPQREKIENTRITCEYCGSNIELNIHDEANCQNCGSSCKDNHELKAYIKMNEIIDIEHNKYSELNEIISNLNSKNQKFDKFMTHNYWYAKLFGKVLILFPIIPAIIVILLPNIIKYTILVVNFTILDSLPLIFIFYILYKTYIK